MDYVVKMDSEKVRMFSGVSYNYIEKWVELYCRGGKVEIVSLVPCKRLPRAEKRRFKPNLDMPDLRYRPFVSLS